MRMTNDDCDVDKFKQNTPDHFDSIVVFLVSLNIHDPMMMPLNGIHNLFAVVMYLMVHNVMMYTIVHLP